MALTPRASTSRLDEEWKFPGHQLVVGLSFYNGIGRTIEGALVTESTTDLLQCRILRHSRVECNLANQMLD
jgi:hypothetical protein